MLRLNRTDQATHAAREVARAEALLSEVFGFNGRSAATALNDEAVAGGVSVHAAALAVIANWATRAPILEHRRRGPEE